MTLPDMRITYGGPDKVQIVPQPMMQPAKCVLCGAPADGRPFVDIGLYLDFYGGVYFCCYCMVDVANKLGYHTPTQYEEVQHKLTAALSENGILADANNDLRSIVGNLLGMDPNGCVQLVADYKDFQQWRASNPQQRQLDFGTDEQIDKSGSNDIPNVSVDDSEFDIELGK